MDDFINNYNDKKCYLKEEVVNQGFYLICDVKIFFDLSRDLKEKQILFGGRNAMSIVLNMVYLSI